MVALGNKIALGAHGKLEGTLEGTLEGAVADIQASGAQSPPVLAECA